MNAWTTVSAAVKIVSRAFRFLALWIWNPLFKMNLLQLSAICCDKRTAFSSCNSVELFTLLDAVTITMQWRCLQQIVKTAGDVVRVLVSRIYRSVRVHGWKDHACPTGKLFCSFTVGQRSWQVLNFAKMSWKLAKGQLWIGTITCGRCVQTHCW